MADFQTAYTALMDQVARPMSETTVLARAKLEINNAIRILQRRHAFRYSERLIELTYPANSVKINLTSVCDGTLRDLLSVQAFVDGSSRNGLLLKYKTYDQIMRERANYQQRRPDSDFETESLVTGNTHADYVMRNHRYYVFATGPHLGLYPTPTLDVNLSLNLHVWFPDLVQPEDTNFFLDYAFDVVMAMASGYMATYLRNSELKTMSSDDLAAAILTLVTWDSQVHESSYVSL